MPEVSVIVPIYNGRKTLSAAVRSLLSQSWTDFEIIAIDDGSTDGSYDLVAGIADPRISLHRQTNQGLAATLNRGIEMAQGRFIARLDQDDLALPERFARQVSMLTEHPEVALLGTWAQIYASEQPTDRYHRHPASAEAINLALQFDNPFVHSSVMMRADALRSTGGYHVHEVRGFPEDYELWSRMAGRFRVANLPEVLTIYREVPGSITRVSVEEILSNVVAVAEKNLTSLLGSAHSREAKILANLYHGRSVTIFSALKSLGVWQKVVSRQRDGDESPAADYAATYGRIYRRLLIRALQTLPGASYVTDILRAARNG